MSDDEKTKFKVLEFKKPLSENEEFPKEIIQSLEKLLVEAKAGTLRNLVIYAEAMKDEESSTNIYITWNEFGNARESLGCLRELEEYVVHSLFHDHGDE